VTGAFLILAMTARTEPEGQYILSASEEADEGYVQCRVKFP